MLRKRIYYGIVFALLAVAAVFCIQRDIEAEDYANDIKMDYQRCFTEMVQYVDDLQVSLLKARFVNDPGQMVRLSGEIYRQAAAASANLALLPLTGEPLQNLSEFLNQSGDFAQALSYKMLEGEKITEEEYKNLAALGEYATVIASSLDGDLEDLYNGTLSISRVADAATVSGIDKAMGEVEDQLHDYPALIYDGPFSSHLTDRKPLFIEGMSEITQDEAINKAKAITGDGAEYECVLEEGTVPAYYIYDKENRRSIAITKKGGYLLSYLNDREVGDAVKTLSDAKIAGVQFLDAQGFIGMQENYYEVIGNVAVINYAPKQEDYTLYPDLVKVKVALDTGEVIGCETRGYIMYHKQRQIPEIKVTKEAAQSKVNSHVEIKSVTLAVIPTSDGMETFTWQIEGRIDEQRCLIYVNTQTGAEEKLFLLIESPSGVLAV